MRNLLSRLLHREPPPSPLILDNRPIKTFYVGNVCGWAVHFYRKDKWFHFVARKGNETNRINLGQDPREAWADFYQELAALEPRNNI